MNGKPLQEMTFEELGERMRELQAEIDAEPKFDIRDFIESSGAYGKRSPA